MSVRRTASGGRSDMRPSVFGTMNSRRQKATAPAHSTIATGDNSNRNKKHRPKPVKKNNNGNNENKSEAN
jgi:hypothetical protein